MFIKANLGVAVTLYDKSIPIQILSNTFATETNWLSLIPLSRK